MLWFKAALVRAIKTMAQSAIAIIGTATVLNDVDWKMCLSAVAVSGILSLLTSVAGLPEVPTGSSDPEEYDGDPEDDFEGSEE